MSSFCTNTVLATLLHKIQFIRATLNISFEVKENIFKVDDSNT